MNRRQFLKEFSIRVWRLWKILVAFKRKFKRKRK